MMNDQTKYALQNNQGNQGMVARIAAEAGLTPEEVAAALQIKPDDAQRYFGDAQQAQSPGMAAGGVPVAKPPMPAQAAPAVQAPAAPMAKPPMPAPQPAQPAPHPMAKPPMPAPAAPEAQAAPPAAKPPMPAPAPAAKPQMAGQMRAGRRMQVLNDEEAFDNGFNRSRGVWR